MSIDVSILIPVLNEVDNVEPLHAELDVVLRPLALDYELIFVDDGSTDGTTPARGHPGRGSGTRSRRLPQAQLRPDGRASAALDLAR